MCRREDLKRWSPRGPIRAYCGRKDEKLLSLCSCVFSVCLCTQLWAFILAAYLWKAPGHRIILIMTESVHIPPQPLFRDGTASSIHKYSDTSSHFINSLVELWKELCSESMLQHVICSTLLHCIRLLSAVLTWDILHWDGIELLSRI